MDNLQDLYEHPVNENEFYKTIHYKDPISDEEFTELQSLAYSAMSEDHSHRATLLTGLVSPGNYRDVYTLEDWETKEKWDIYRNKNFVNHITVAVDDKLVGYVRYKTGFTGFYHLGGFPGKITDSIEIEEMYIKPEFRRKHLGSELLKHLKADIKARKSYHNAVINVKANNFDAIKFYHRVGFRDIEAVYCGRPKLPQWRLVKGLTLKPITLGVFQKKAKEHLDQLRTQLRDSSYVFYPLASSEDKIFDFLYEQIKSNKALRIYDIVNENSNIDYGWVALGPVKTAETGEMWSCYPLVLNNTGWRQLGSVIVAIHEIIKTLVPKKTPSLMLGLLRNHDIVEIPVSHMACLDKVMSGRIW